MTKFTDSQMLAFQLLTPLHVGSHTDKYTSFEYIIYQGKLYFVDENKLFVFLKGKNLLSKYVSEINREGPNFRIYNFLRENLGNIESNLVEDISRYKAIVETDKNFLEFRPLIRDGWGVPYIPGSTIKGLIRTAILYKVLKTLKDKDLKKFEKEIVEPIRRTPKEDFRKREPFKRLINKWLQDFQIDKKENSPHTDWLRLIRVRDAYPIFQSTTKIYEVVVFSYNGRNWQEKKDMPIFLECLPPLSLYQFELSLDTVLLEKFRISRKLKVVENAYPRKIEDIFETLDEFSSDLLIEEQKSFDRHPVLKKWYEASLSKEIFRLGWGGGLLSKSIFLLLPEDLRKLIRNYLRHDRGEALAPKSRRMVKLPQKLLPLGWAKWVHDGETVLRTKKFKIVLKAQRGKFTLVKVDENNA